MMDYLFQYGLYTVAVLLILCGLAGTIIPALPGIPMIFAGAWVIGYVENFEHIGFWTLVALGVLTVISVRASSLITRASVGGLTRLKSSVLAI